MIERGGANPNLTTLLRVASGFGVSLASLVETEPAPPRVLLGEANGRVLWRTAKGSRAGLLVAAGALELWRWSIAPGDRRDGQPHSAGTLEALLVVEGELTLHVQTSRRRWRRVGRHCSRAIGPTPTRTREQHRSFSSSLCTNPSLEPEVAAGRRGPAVS
jgi:transcriptional regulator with XRE-family HTH domain